MKALKAVLSGLDERDALLFLGLALLGAGLWQINLPVALIAVGAVLIYVAIAGTK